MEARQEWVARETGATLGTTVMPVCQEHFEELKAKGHFIPAEPPQSTT